MTDVDIETMAAVLATHEELELGDEPACILCLNAAGYRAVEIFAWLDEAREKAISMRGLMYDTEALREALIERNRT
jgi:hypothetical protein